MSKVYNDFLDELNNDSACFTSIGFRIKPPQYINIMKKNLLSEFNVFVKTNKLYYFDYNCKVINDWTLKLFSYNNDETNLVNNLIIINNNYYFVKHATYNEEENYTNIKIYPHLESSTHINSCSIVGYVDNRQPTTEHINSCSVVGYIGDRLHI